MIYKKLYIKDISSFPYKGDAYFEVYLNEMNSELNIEPRPGLIVLPGGGYEYCSKREAEPVALRFASEGFNTFLLNYSCNVSYPKPHLELAILMNYLNSNCDEFNLRKNAISVIGFSAGGHLAASYSYLYEEIGKEYKMDAKKLKPFATILGYPVTLMTLPTLSKTSDIITGNKPELIKKLNVVDHVSKDYPLVYLFSTDCDACVNIKHSLDLIEALKDKKVPHEYDIFKQGYHGGSLYNRCVYDSNINFKEIKENRQWVEHAVEFIFSLLK